MDRDQTSDDNHVARAIQEERERCMDIVERYVPEGGIKDRVKGHILPVPDPTP